MSNDRPWQKKIVSHHDLNYNWSFISVPEDGVILGVKTIVASAYKLCDSQGNHALMPNGEKGYHVDMTTVLKTFTRDEYQKLLKGSNEPIQ